MGEPDPNLQLDFSNTEIAFASKSNKELKNTVRLFSLMNKQWLVSIGSSLGAMALKFNLPFARRITHKTIFKQFCGGESLMDCQPTIDQLFKYKTLTVLDYGLEAKSTDEELQAVQDELIRAIELAASNNSVPVVSIKISALVDNALLEAKQSNGTLNDIEQKEYDKLVSRLINIANKAYELKVGVFIDAEESWIQDSIDELVEMLMEKFNGEEVIVYNTFQLYRHDRLAYLKASYKQAKAKNYKLGAKLVRGAYMEKERARADELNYPSPIHKNKAAVDQDYDEAIRFCVEHYEDIASCCASHNAVSNQLQAQLIHDQEIRKNHEHLNFCQLYGMSDYISFNLADKGYNVAKYVPYGPIKEVIPYLIRRAQENTSVTGEMSRELHFLSEELNRRRK